MAGSVFTAFLRGISAPRRYGRRQKAGGFQKAEGRRLSEGRRQEAGGRRQESTVIYFISP
jgi:hypothetical protein